jgi:hypothetical protein
MKSDDRDPIVEGLMDGLEPPQPPPELRARVLAAARSAKTAPDVWSRIWNHGGLRMAWAASLVMLLAGHVLIGIGTGPVIDSDLVAENRVDEYFVEFLRPTRIADNARPIVGLFANGNNLIDLELEGNPS